jgi:hypothetical protein
VRVDDLDLGPKKQLPDGATVVWCREQGTICSSSQVLVVVAIDFDIHRIYRDSRLRCRRDGRMDVTSRHVIGTLCNRFTLERG